MPSMKGELQNAWLESEKTDQEYQEKGHGNIIKLIIKYSWPAD